MKYFISMNLIFIAMINFLCAGADIQNHGLIDQILQADFIIIGKHHNSRRWKIWWCL